MTTEETITKAHDVLTLAKKRAAEMKIAGYSPSGEPVVGLLLTEPEIDFLLESIEHAL